MLKNKKILFLAILVLFLIALGFGSKTVFAAGDCTSAGGTCVGKTNCTPPQVNPDGVGAVSAECTAKYGLGNGACCKDPAPPPPPGDPQSCQSKDAASGNRGYYTCYPSCSGNFVTDPDSGSCSTGVCCKLRSCGDLNPGATCKKAPCDSAKESEAFGFCPDATGGSVCCKPKTGGGPPPPPPGGDPPSGPGGGMWNVGELGSYGLPSGTISGIIKSLVSWLLYIFGFLGIIAFVISGIFYLTAAGDAEQEKKAKLAMKMGIMGVVVALSGFVIIKAIDAVLNAGMGF